MGRGKQTAGGCAHASPVVVEPTPGGRAARCLVCGVVGPVRMSSELALAALRDAVRPALHGQG